MPEPLKLVKTTIVKDWIDEFGHMNIAHYLTVFDLANWAFWNLVNEPEVMEERSGHEYAILENHVHYLDELVEGDKVWISSQLLSHDNKRLILFHHLHREDNANICATNEVKFLGFNLETRRAENFIPKVADRLDDIAKSHQKLETPEQAGMGIALKKT